MNTVKEFGKSSKDQERKLYEIRDHQIMRNTVTGLETGQMGEKHRHRTRNTVKGRETLLNDEEYFQRARNTVKQRGTEFKNIITLRLQETELGNQRHD